MAELNIQQINAQLNILLQIVMGALQKKGELSQEKKKCNHVR